MTRILKKIIRFIFIVLMTTLGPLIFSLLVLLGILFFSPTTLVNLKNIDFVLSKTHILKSWSWNKGEIKHKWIHWNDRGFSGSFNDLCFSYERNNTKIESCIEKMYWNFELRWDFKIGLSYIINEPLVIESRLTKISIVTRDNSSHQRIKGTEYLDYWDLIWKKSVPDLDFNFSRIDLELDDKNWSFDLKIIKKEKELRLFSMGYRLRATPTEIALTGAFRLPLPYDLKTRKQLYFDEIKLISHIGPSDIDFNFNAIIESAKLAFKTAIKRHLLRNDVPIEQIIKNLLIHGQGHLNIKKLTQTIKKVMRPPFNILPAPLNILEGPLNIKWSAVPLSREFDVNFKILSEINLRGAMQAFVLEMKCDLPFSIHQKKIGPVAIGLDFKKVFLRLPRLAKNRLPPQLRPDPRIKGVKIVAENRNARTKKRVTKKMPVSLELEAEGARALQIKTNLLDEILKLNFKLAIEKNKIQDGYIEALPIRTTLFKRPIYVSFLRFTFLAPLEPEINSVVEFILPEYKVTLKLQGPLSKPRTAFSSFPPLPQDDIIAVLLFGRPLSGLSADDKIATKNVGQIASQGILSLAVLYYLAGSPVESLGYDPDSKVVSAQFGISKRSSFHIESGKEGSGVLGSYGVRHSLGKGWYIDTAVAQKNDSTSQEGKNLGVLLERIIAY